MVTADCCGASWHCFSSECDGQGGAAILLQKDVFEKAELVGVAEHAVAVRSNGIVFISVYVPVNIDRGSFQGLCETILGWVPKAQQRVGCIMGGDWNRHADDRRWAKRLRDHQLHICTCPVPFTFVRANQSKGTCLMSSLDRVATNMASAQITQSSP